MNNSDRFDTFTEQTRKVLILAGEEARHFQHSAIGTEHILLGLVREGESIAAHVLESQGVTLEEVRKAVEEAKGLVAEGSGIAATVLAEMGVGLEKMREQVEPGYEAGDWSVSGDIKLQPKLMYVIELASNEARRLSHSSIGTGHLLLALVPGREDEGIEASLLKKLGVDMDNLRTTLRHALTEKVSMSEQETKAMTDEISEEGIYASNASIASIERFTESGAR